MHYKPIKKESKNNLNVTFEILTICDCVENIFYLREEFCYILGKNLLIYSMILQDFEIFTEYILFKSSIYLLLYISFESVFSAFKNRIGKTISE